MHLRLLSAIAVVFGLSTSVAVADDGNIELTPAQKAVFDSDHLHGLKSNTALHYSYSEAGSLANSFEDSATITIQSIGADGKKTIISDFLSGDRKMPFPPFEMVQGNPVIMAFLERDVAEMSRLTGGSTLFFRNRIRDGFASATLSQVKPVTVTFEGRPVAAREVTVQPYVGAPMIERFPKFEHKSYVFVLADAVPGGIHSIRAEAPGDKDGAPLERETLTYLSVDNSVAPQGATK